MQPLAAPVNILWILLCFATATQNLFWQLFSSLFHTEDPLIWAANFHPLSASSDSAAFDLLQFFSKAHEQLHTSLLTQQQSRIFSHTFAWLFSHHWPFPLQQACPQCLPNPLLWLQEWTQPANCCWFASWSKCRLNSSSNNSLKTPKCGGTVVSWKSAYGQNTLQACQWGSGCLF